MHGLGYLPYFCKLLYHYPVEKKKKKIYSRRSVIQIKILLRCLFYFTMVFFSFIFSLLPFFFFWCGSNNHTKQMFEETQTVIKTSNKNIYRPPNGEETNIMTQHNWKLMILFRHISKDYEGLDSTSTRWRKKDFNHT